MDKGENLTESTVITQMDILLRTSTRFEELRNEYYITVSDNDNDQVGSSLSALEDEILNTEFGDSDKNTIKTLGLRWNPKEDCFSINVTPSTNIPTKRAVLSNIAKLFDPLGLLEPVIGDIKLLLHGKKLTGKIKNLNPFLDEDEILKVGGRIQHISVNFDQRYPVILPDKKSVPSEDQGYQFGDSNKNTIKTLGLRWNPKENFFSFNVTPSTGIPTKRAVLADIAKLGPVIVKAKIFLQRLWRHKIEWDQELPHQDQEKREWDIFRYSFGDITKTQIPLCILTYSIKEH
ncbi:hypothetical protein HNY73_003834 [Argiope bruennichi]|uniref:Uncharacterized protein n=1 Tax=Argiope bruennichi TaxID=94029 RepID=A0A8T0FLX7_ARGBR|nr:hypothetical protein HNY73_003834 [Argiope bruennichi]